MALTHLASLDGASVVGREVVLPAEGAPGGCFQAMGSDMLQPTAPAAEGIWPPRLLEGVDLVTASEQSDPGLAEVAKGHLPENRDHHRRGAVLVRLEPGPGLSPAQPPDISRDMHPTVFRLKLLPELPQATVSRPSHVPGKQDVMDPVPLPLLLGDNIPDAAVRYTGRPKYRTPVLQEVLQGGGGGCNAKDSEGIRAPDPLDSDAANALLVEGMRVFVCAYM